jgi:thiol-disulfide isomerase/thioredoxin
MKRSVFLLAGALLLAPTYPASSQDKQEVALRAVKYDELGKEVARHRGKVVLVDFWATWCPPCREKFPHMVTLGHKHQAEGLVLISVTVDDMDSKDDALAFLRAQKAVFTNLLLDEPRKLWTTKLRTISVPCYYVFNRQGQWVQFTSPDGKAPIDYAKMDQTVLEFLKEK